MNTKQYDGFSDSFRDSNHERDGRRTPRDLDEGGAPADGSSLESRDEFNDPNGDDHDARSEAPAAPRREARDRHDEQPTTGADEKKSSTTAGLWIALILGALLLILLLVFVVQNNTSAAFEYFQWSFNLPLGVAMLGAAVAGALIMALVGSVRIMQLSWQLRKYRKQHEKMQKTLRR